MIIRILLLCLVTVTSLSGCLYYGDIHGNSKRLSEADLSQKHVYKIPPMVKTGNWWDSLHDPQLNQLITVALADSPDLKSAEARVRRAKHIAEESASSLWPSLDSNGYVEKEHFSYFGLIPPPFNGMTFNIGDVALNFNYEFDFWGKNRQTLAAKVSEECATLGDLAEARLVISTAVATTYFQLLDEIEQTRIARAYWQKTNELYEIILDRAKNGIESDIPLKTAITSVQTARLTIDQYRQAEMISRHQLAALMGQNPFSTSIETKKFSFHHYRTKLPSYLAANLLAHRPDIYAAKSRAIAAAHQINVAKTLFFPDFNLSALFSYQSVGLGHLFDPVSQNKGGGLAFDLPLFDAGARRANLGVKYAEYDDAVNSYNQTILTALREVADEVSTLRSLNSQLTSQDSAVRAVKHNYKLFSSRYNHGIVDYVPVLEIRQALLQQEAVLVNLQTRHLQAIVVMQKALGGVDLSIQG